MEKRKPKIFILGVSGFLGFHLAHRLRENYLVSGASFSHHTPLPDAQIFPIDPKKPEILETLVRIHAPDIVINAAGMTNKKMIEAMPKVADNVNILMAVSLAILANKMRAPFIQLSCARVYDGSEGGYREDNMDYSLRDDLARQKLAAESYIRAQTMESTILRLGAVQGIGHFYRPTPFDSLRFALSAKKKVEAAKKQIQSYMSVRSFVDAIVAILAAEFPGKHRIFNLGGPTLSEYDFSEGWARLVMGSGDLVKAPQEEDPSNHSIVSDNFKATFPAWKPETQDEMYLNILRDLTPGVGVKKWQKILQIP